MILIHILKKNDKISGPFKHLLENCLFRKDHAVSTVRRDETMIDDWLQRYILYGVVLNSGTREKENRNLASQ